MTKISYAGKPVAEQANPEMSTRQLVEQMDRRELERFGSKLSRSRVDALFSQIMRNWSLSHHTKAVVVDAYDSAVRRAKKEGKTSVEIADIDAALQHAEMELICGGWGNDKEALKMVDEERLYLARLETMPAPVRKKELGIGTQLERIGAKKREIVAERLRHDVNERIKSLSEELSTVSTEKERAALNGRLEMFLYDVVFLGLDADSRLRLDLLERMLKIEKAEQGRFPQTGRDTLESEIAALKKEAMEERMSALRRRDVPWQLKESI